MVADKPWIEDVIPHYYGSDGMSRITPALTAAYCLKCPVVDLHYETGPSFVARDQVQQ